MDVEHHKAPAVLASDVERDEVLVRLHTAFAEGRLSDTELDERTASVLAARTRPELDRLLADLPSAGPAGAPERSEAVKSRPGRFQVAYKNVLRRGGRWRVPDRYTTVVYKGECHLDLRDAELESEVTRIRALAYKSTIQITVPPGVRVELTGFGVSGEVYGDPSPRTRVVHVRGFAYKGLIDVRS